MSESVRRKLLSRVVAPASGLVVVAIATTLFVSGGRGGEIKVAPSQASKPVVTSKTAQGATANGPSVWNEAAELARCNTASLQDLGFDSEAINPDGRTTTMWDIATAGTPTDPKKPVAVTFDARELCRERVALVPDPGGNMGVQFVVENGKLVGKYCEKKVSVFNYGPDNTKTEYIDCRTPIPPDEAAARLAAQRAARANG